MALNRESLEQIYTNMILWEDKEARIWQWRKDSFFDIWCWENWTPTFMKESD